MPTAQPDTYRFSIGSWNISEFIGIDVKALRTTKGAGATQHLSNSKGFFLAMVDKVRSLDRAQEAAFIAECDYEGLERFIVNHLMGV